MLSHQRASLLEDRPPSGRRIGSRKILEAGAADNSIIRLLVLDTNPATPELIEKALWVWPHRIATARSAQNAAEMCQHLEPVALIVALDFPSDSRVSIIRALRDQIPNAVIIAVGTAGQTSNPGPILDMGANAVLSRDSLQRPTLHDLLMRFRPQKATGSESAALAEQPMPLPWRESQIVGSLICDIDGRIVCANECLARWLNFRSPDELAGKSVCRDVLSNSADWVSWKTVAGDLSAILHSSVTVKAGNAQFLWMNVEVFAAPNSPTYIQAVFVDQSELVHLTGRIGHCQE